MRNYLLIAFVFCSTTFVFSQGKGYFGKKTVISIDGSLRGALFYKWLSDGDQYSRGGEKVNRFFSGGFSASMSHYFTNSVGLGIDYSMTFNHLRMPFNKMSYNYPIGYYDMGEGRMTIESLKMSTYYIIPKFEWASNGNLPIGICMSLGLGYSHSKILDDKVTIHYSGYYSNDTGLKTDFTQTESTASYRPLHGVVLEYGVKLRVPVTRFMTFNVGSNLRFHMPHFSEISLGTNVYSDVENGVRNSMRLSRGLNLVDVRAGLSFILF